jgi:hypothetical protein
MYLLSVDHILDINRPKEKRRGQQKEWMPVPAIHEPGVPVGAPKGAAAGPGRQVPVGVQVNLGYNADEIWIAPGGFEAPTYGLWQKGWGG